MQRSRSNSLGEDAWCIDIQGNFSEHGVEEAKILVRSWCHRMQYFYNLEMSAAPSSDFSFAPAVVEAYGEPTELAALAGMVDHPKWPKWIKRIEAIRRIPRV